MGLNHPTRVEIDLIGIAGWRRVGMGLGIAALTQMKCPSLLLLVFLGFGLTAPAGAASLGWLHRRWGTEDGLPQNSVQAIARDRLGYLWLGTQEGLVRYDGQRFSCATAATSRQH